MRQVRGEEGFTLRTLGGLLQLHLECLLLLPEGLTRRRLQSGRGEKIWKHVGETERCHLRMPAACGRSELAERLQLSLSSGQVSYCVVAWHSSAITPIARLEAAAAARAMMTAAVGQTFWDIAKIAHSADAETGPMPCRLVEGVDAVSAVVTGRDLVLAKASGGLLRYARLGQFWRVVEHFWQAGRG